MASDRGETRLPGELGRDPRIKDMEDIGTVKQNIGNVPGPFLVAPVGSAPDEMWLEALPRLTTLWGGQGLVLNVTASETLTFWFTRSDHASRHRGTLQRSPEKKGKTRAHCCLFTGRAEPLCRNGAGARQPRFSPWAGGWTALPGLAGGWVDPCICVLDRGMWAGAVSATFRAGRKVPRVLAVKGSSVEQTHSGRTLGPPPGETRFTVAWDADWRKTCVKTLNLRDCYLRS